MSLDFDNITKPQKYTFNKHSSRRCQVKFLFFTARKFEHQKFLFKLHLHLIPKFFIFSFLAILAVVFSVAAGFTLYTVYPKSTPEYLKTLLFEDIQEKNLDKIDEIMDAEAVYTEKNGHYYIVTGKKLATPVMFYFKVAEQYMKRCSTEISFNPCGSRPECRSYGGSECLYIFVGDVCGCLNPSPPWECNIF